MKFQFPFLSYVDILVVYRYTRRNSVIFHELKFYVQGIYEDRFFENLIADGKYYFH